MRHELPLDEDIPLLQESLLLLGDRADRAMGYFYARLFLDDPSLRALFPPAMDTQRERFFRALTGAVRNLADPETFEATLHRMGSDHRKYGVRPEHYGPFGRALISALARHLEDLWLPELEDAWWRAYNYMATVMIEGAEVGAAEEPAWWSAEIVAHERRAVDLAVITLRTDRPYSYRAGQYTTVETPYQPRSWRTYSLATAPSPNGLLELHVRVVGGGWVSGPLVWRAAVGDVLRLGAPMGEMVVDQASHRDLLCVAGGTGLAPIKAIVEDMTRWNTARKVHVFFGARRSEDLYDLGALHRMAALHLWLTVVPAVSDQVTFEGARGQLPDVVAREGSWTDREAFVCGSPAMTRATVTRLLELGVPEAQVHYDATGDVQPMAAQVIDLRRSRAVVAARREVTGGSPGRR